MIRRFYPFLISFLAMLLDTAVIPVFYSGICTIPLTLAVVFCIGILKGKLLGMLHGMIVGLMLDITVGSIPRMTVMCIACAFLVDLILNEAASGKRIHWRHALVRHALCIAPMYLLCEIVILFYQYFNTAMFEWIYLRNVLIRTAIFTVFTVLLCPVLKFVFFGPKHQQKNYTNTSKYREVRHF